MKIMSFASINTISRPEGNDFHQQPEPKSVSFSQVPLNGTFSDQGIEWRKISQSQARKSYDGQLPRGRFRLVNFDPQAQVTY